MSYKSHDRLFSSMCVHAVLSGDKIDYFNFLYPYRA